MKVLTEKFARLCLKHSRLMFYILVFFYCGIFTFVLLNFKVSTVWILLVDFICIIISFFVVYGAPGELMNRALALLDDFCYPEALLEECEKQETRFKKGAYRVIVLINKSAALIMMGDNEKAKDILVALNPEESSFSAASKCIYFNNLAGIYFDEGHNEKGESLMERAYNCFEAVYDKKHKKTLESMLQLSEAEKNFREGNYERVMEITENLPTDKLRPKVVVAHLQGKAYIQLGENSKAKDKLDFVSEKGGTLYIAKEARKLLKEIKI